MLLCGDEHPFAIYPGAIPAEVCDAALAEGLDLAPREGEAGKDPEGRWRKGAVRFFPVDHWLGELLHGAAVRANSEANWHYALLGPEAVQLATYGAEDHYDWHSDSFTDGETARKLSVTVQLSEPDAYTGGDLGFRRFGVAASEEWTVPEVARQRGTIVVFPSYLVHRVAPVGQGTRRSLVAWVRGPRFV